MIRQIDNEDLSYEFNEDNNKIRFVDIEEVPAVVSNNNQGKKKMKKVIVVEERKFEEEKKDFPSLI